MQTDSDTLNSSPGCSLSQTTPLQSEEDIGHWIFYFERWQSGLLVSYTCQ